MEEQKTENHATAESIKSTILLDEFKSYPILGNKWLARIGKTLREPSLILEKRTGKVWLIPGLFPKNHTFTKLNVI